MRLLKSLLLTSGLCVAAASASAQNIACGQDYVVESGDYLSSIARRVYGDTANYTLIYSANVDIIGGDPGAINVGDRLFIPCLDGAVQASTADASAIRQRTIEALPGPSGDRPIRVLTATGWAPFMDEDQAQGGLLTEIINLALENADSKPEYQIDFINDDGAHLQPLITDHAYDISIGWSQPNCELFDKLEDESKFRCNNLAFSDPLYEEVLGYYSPSADPAFAEHSALHGKRICRAEAYTLAPMEEVDLVAPVIEVVRAPTAADCVNFILENKADAALIAVDVAEGRIAELGAQDRVQMHEALTFVDVLHAVIAKTHPQADEILAVVNNGLGNIKETGLWFQTVRRHMTAFRELSQG
ncbi:LysM peptidoglycan-binding domain-containing protein [Yoonia sp. R2-816]|uniref:LysM peptidoglycan-binding domain-containing protein n=1 Tax=Yoonia sp. R2-816 TaxID=3342638 RepID=UPI00372C126D